MAPLSGVTSTARGDGGVASGAGRGVLEHAASVPRIVAATAPRARRKALGMWVILLELLAALALLIFIVWWTMFSGRRKGERRDGEPPP